MIIAIQQTSPLNKWLVKFKLKKPLTIEVFRSDTGFSINSNNKHCLKGMTLSFDEKDAKILNPDRTVPTFEHEIIISNASNL